LALLLAGVLFYRFEAAGLSKFLSQGIASPAARSFAMGILLREILPIYGLSGFAVWTAAWLWGRLPWGLGSEWGRTWTGKEAFLITLAGLTWIHLCLWWKVPTALWVIPVLSKVPFWLLFPGLLLIWSVPLLRWLHRRDIGPGRVLGTSLGWVLAWTCLAAVPFWARRTPAPAPHGSAPVKLLVLGVDGLRPDVAEPRGLQQFDGLHFPNVYTPVPNTRLCYSILWGGDPAHYSVGHALPSLEELKGNIHYDLLLALKAKGLKARFYIDDGGTIGLSGRTDYFDEVLMPARGWENFVNTNLAVHVPLYASWLDALRVFPTTTPWSSVEAGLLAAVEHGRGADVVMYHSCIVHQPLFLSRVELGEIDRWWTLSPGDMRPFMAWWQAPLDKDDQFDSRRDPLKFYGIRVGKVLAAWSKIWRQLESDPDYKAATRVFLSDHGERFYHASEHIRLMGSHGFDLDPWTLRVPFVLAGPGIPTAQGTDQAVSLLELRDAMWNWAVEGTPISPQSFGRWPMAPSRYNTLSTDFFRASEIQYRQTDTKEIVERGAILSDGLWLLGYKKSAEERGKDVSLAEADKNRLTIWKPLKNGGGHKLVFTGLDLVEESLVDEETFHAAKLRIEKTFFHNWKGAP
jgi:hypothetical protein